MAEEQNKKPLKTIKLTKPIEDEEGNLITEIKLTRRPCGGDWLGFPIANPTIPDFLRVCSKLTGIQLPFLKKMDSADAMEIAEELSGFLLKE